MTTLFLVVGLSVLVGAALWGLLDPDPGSTISPARPRWCCFGTYITTTGGQTLIIAGGGPGAATLAITAPAPRPPVPAAITPQHTPDATAPPRSDTDLRPTPHVIPRPDRHDRTGYSQPAELAELEHLWRRPARQPSTAIIATAPGPAPDAPSNLSTPG
jgi:hypothetical protein